MTAANIAKTLKKYQKASPKGKKRQEYLRNFEVKMVYRTTKTENPKTTKKMVEKVLGKMN